MTTENEIENAFLEGKNVYISGVGGTGKSFLLKNLYNKNKNDGQSYLTSTTGISSYNIGGRTIHSWAGFICPSNMTDGDAVIKKILNIIKKDSRISKRIKNTKCLFIDEISMLGATYFTLLDIITRNLLNPDLVFGGIQIICTGDMLQLPPVKDLFPFQSDIWDDLKFKYFNLTICHRFNDEEYIELLKRARQGKLNKNDKDLLKSRIKPPSGEITPTILLSKNIDVDTINKTELEKLVGDCTIFKSVDQVLSLKGNPISGDIPPEIETEIHGDKLTYLKVGAQVMLTINIDIDSGLFNGSRGIVKEILPEEIKVKFMNGVETQIPLHIFTIETDFCTYTRKTFPLKLCWAISQHKSQGLTLDCIYIDIGHNIFCAGQAYVALSRCRNLNSLFIKSFVPEKIYADKLALKFEEKMLYQISQKYILTPNMRVLN